MLNFFFYVSFQILELGDGKSSTISQAKPSFYMSAEWGFWKHC